MINETEYHIGDPVEVEFVDMKRGTFWRPATVVAVYTHQVSVAFHDSERMAVQRRHVRPQQRKETP